MTTATRRLALLGLVVAVLGGAVAAYFFAADGRAREGSAGAAKSQARKASAARAVLISTVVAEPRSLEVYEEVVGSLENVMDPRIAAEVAGRVTRVLAFTGKKVKQGELLAEIDAGDFEIQSRGDAADIKRLQALLANQERIVERQEKLVGQGFISQNALDEAIAQRSVLREQLSAARARAESTGRSLGKTKVVAPIDGEIETQVVAPGDYVKVGDPLFRLVGTQRMRAHLLFPESAANRIRPGLTVRLESPAAPGRPIQSAIDEIRPTVSAGNRALDAIVRFETTDGAFRGGGSVNARVVLELKKNALMVPEQSVVLRPAGKVVYVVSEGRVAQRRVETGLKQDGLQEILSGLSAGELVASDGAGFLSDGAAVTLASRKGKS
ncbi:MAG TPA: efflux RND transporter periplasmic adaptor subunit [Burkholderiales bacterium]|nr:efflux RND transporter periplasmic adaptor subunit [Burkholderiales bacterium]